MPIPEAPEKRPLDENGSPISTPLEIEQARILAETVARENAALTGGKPRPKRDDDLDPHERKRGRSR